MSPNIIDKYKSEWNENKCCMNCTKYTLERLSLALKRFKPGKFLETKFAMSYFRQDPSARFLKGDKKRADDDDEAS